MLAALARSLEACNPEPGPNPNADPNPEPNQVVGAMCPFARELEFKLEVFGENSCSRWHQDKYAGRAIVSYTGHVGKIRHVVGQTYGKQVREAINSVTPKVELAEYRSDVLSVNPTGGIPCAAPASDSAPSRVVWAAVAAAEQ